MLQNDRIDVASLDVIFNRMLETITNSKDDIFIISEQSRRSFEQMQQELEIIRHELRLMKLIIWKNCCSYPSIV